MRFSCHSRLLAISGLVIGILFSACKPSVPAGSEDAAAKPGAKGSRVAVVVSTLNNSWFVVLAETARDGAKELGYEAVIFDSKNDPAKESEHFDNLIASAYGSLA